MRLTVFVTVIFIITPRILLVYLFTTFCDEASLFFYDGLMHCPIIRKPRRAIRNSISESWKNFQNRNFNFRIVKKLSESDFQFQNREKTFRIGISISESWKIFQNRNYNFRSWNPEFNFRIVKKIFRIGITISESELQFQIVESGFQFQNREKIFRIEISISESSFRIGITIVKKSNKKISKATL